MCTVIASLEMQWLYRLAVGHVPSEDFQIPLGRAEVRATLWGWGLQSRAQGETHGPACTPSVRSYPLPFSCRCVYVPTSL